MDTVIVRRRPTVNAVAAGGVTLTSQPVHFSLTYMYYERMKLSYLCTAE